MKQQIVVLGSAGMLGRYVYSYFKQFPEYDVVGLTRKEIGDFKDLTTIGKVASAIACEIGLYLPTIIINTSGVIKPQIDKVGKLTTIQINSLLPHVLAEFCDKFKFKFIHAQTDCCHGTRGNYKVSDEHDCSDFYGRTKSLGEPDNAVVIKTSIIGEEVDTSRSLVEWVKSNAGKTINGFTNHQWNGNTCLEWAKFAKFCIEGNLPYLTYHLTGQSVNKYTLLDQINSTYNLGITIKSVEDSTSIDRTLVSNCQHLYSTPGLREQLEEMKDFGPTLRG